METPTETTVTPENSIQLWSGTIAASQLEIISKLAYDFFQNELYRNRVYLDYVFSPSSAHTYYNTGSLKIIATNTATLDSETRERVKVNVTGFFNYMKGYMKRIDEEQAEINMKRIRKEAKAQKKAAKIKSKP